MSRPRLISCLACCAALVPAACGTGDEAESAPESTAAPQLTEVGCRPVEEPQPKGAQDVPEPTEELDPALTHVATVSTSCGDFEITLDVESSPETTASFAHLAELDFYAGTAFHRVSPGFVIQGGDPLGDGTGGPGYSVEEAPPDDLVYEEGVVAMAKMQVEPAGTSGSQFFVVTQHSDVLPPDYALLGRVTSGMDVVERIAASEVAGQAAADPADSERPVEPIMIEDVSVSSTS